MERRRDGETERQRDNRSVSLSLRPSVTSPARRHRLGPFDLHFTEQITGAAELLGQEEHVADVYGDGAIGADVVSVIAAQPFVVAVEDQPSDFAAPVHQGRA